MKAVWQDAVIAASDATVVVEGNHYFPPDAVRRDRLRPSATRTRCGWKGEAGYCDIVVGDAINTDAAWFYADPKPAAEAIRGYFAFWRGVRVVADDTPGEP